MKEGEIKKRINITIEKAYSEIWSHYCANTVVDVLDEAKKEWLEIEEMELPLNKNGQVDWQKTAELMELRNLKRKEWFIKYFGEKQK